MPDPVTTTEPVTTATPITEPVTTTEQSTDIIVTVTKNAISAALVGGVGVSVFVFIIITVCVVVVLVMHSKFKKTGIEEDNATSYNNAVYGAREGISSRLEHYSTNKGVHPLKLAKVFDLFLHTDAAYAGIGPRVHTKEECLDIQQQV